MSLKGILGERRALLAPGAADALAARVIEDLGYEAAYVTGAGVANAYLGVPDIGLLTVTELAGTVERISDCCRLPLIVDMDTGFGNAVNAARSVRTLERAGAAAVQIEDQAFPKRCGHFDGKRVVTAAEMVGKIRAVADARRDESMLIIARTDARATEGLEAAIGRAELYREAGADVLFVEAPESRDEMRRIGSLAAPQVANLVVGGKTPMLPQAELTELGFALVLYANAALQASLRAMQDVLGHLRRNGSLAGAEDRIAGFEERQRIFGKGAYDRLGARYAVD